MADPSDMALTPASLSLADINAQLAPATEAQPGTDAEQIANAMLAPPADEQMAQVATDNEAPPTAVPGEQNPSNERITLSATPAAAVDVRQSKNSNLLMGLLTIMTCIGAFTGDARVNAAVNLIQGAHADEAPAGSAQEAPKKRPAADAAALPPQQKKRANTPTDTHFAPTNVAPTSVRGQNTIADRILIAAYQQCKTTDPFILNIPAGVVPESNNGASLRDCFWDSENKESYPKHLEKVKCVDGVWVQQPTFVRIDKVHVRFTQAGLDRVCTLV